MSSVRTCALYVACLLPIALVACSDGGPKFGPPASLSTTGSGQTGPAGRALGEPLAVRVTDAQGAALPAIAVTFTITAGGGSVGASSVQTGADGTASTTWTLGQVAGSEQRVEAVVVKPDGGSLRTGFSATARAGAPATLARARGDGQQGGTATALRDSLVVRIADEFGNGIEGISVTWDVQGGGSVAPATSLTNADGIAATSWTLGNMLGGGTVVASAGTLATQTFTATATRSITAISPDLLTGGATVTVTGINFTPAMAENTLLVAGAPATIQEATATSITAVLPAVLPCVPPGNVTVSLISGGVRADRRHPARATQPRTIDVGQILLGSASDPLSCVELPPEGGRYLIAVTNASSTPPVAASLRLRAMTQGAVTAVAAAVEAHPSDHVTADRTGALGRRLQHRAMLESGTRELERLRQRAGVAPALRARATAQRVVPNVGDTMSIRIPRASPTGTISCSAFDEVRARVVHAGTRGIVLEDVTNPFAGTIDSLYRALGAEFDGVQYDIVRHNYGDPLLLDAQLDNNARVVMVFSNRVNVSAGVAGFISPLDFFPRSECATSNVMEIFYGYVPTVNSQEYDAGTIKAWYWDIRATVVHEVKHIASYARRIGNEMQPEETWLEEATAMIAEELWARTVFGYQQGGNTGYLQSVGCEIDGAVDHLPIDCDGRPGIMFIHFAFLADWMEAPSTQSMICAVPQVPCTGPSIYGSGWLFLRWLLDHAGQPEDVVLQALHNSTLRGAQNIQAQFGRSYADLFPEWALAVALDDRSGVTSANPPRVPSWNIRDIYAGLEQDLTSFPTPFPLAVRPFSYGNTELDVATIRGGSAAFFELSGTPSGPQVLEFTAALGQPLGADTRVSIVRIQ